MDNKAIVYKYVDKEQPTLEILKEYGITYEQLKEMVEAEGYSMLSTRDEVLMHKDIEGIRQVDIANGLGLTRQGVSFTVKQLKNEGLLEGSSLVRKKTKVTDELVEQIVSTYKRTLSVSECSEVSGIPLKVCRNILEKEGVLVKDKELSEEDYNTIQYMHWMGASMPEMASRVGLTVARMKTLASNYFNMVDTTLEIMGASIITDYESGMDLESIAIKYNVPVRNICNLLIDNDVEIRQVKSGGEEIVNELYGKYRVSMRYLEKLTGFSSPKVNMLITKYNSENDMQVRKTDMEELKVKVKELQDKGYKPKAIALELDVPLEPVYLAIHKLKTQQEEK